MHCHTNKAPSALIGILAFTLGITAAQAQIGTGWIEQSPSRTIQLDKASGTDSFDWASTTSASVDSPASATYTRSGGIETFRMLDTRSNRSEIRTHDDYSIARQWQGEVRVSSPTNDEAIHQVFQIGGAGPLMMIRQLQSGGGTLQKQGGSVTIATGIANNWVRINSVHMVGSSLKIYINGTLKWSGSSPSGASFYTKYGCYGTLGASSAQIEYRNVRYWRR